MTLQEAVKKAEERVYCFMTAPKIVAECSILGYEIKLTKNGKLKNRSELEAKLISHYTNLYTK